MPQPPYNTIILRKGKDRVVELPYTGEIPDTMIWKDALWSAVGSVGNFEYAYEFEKTLPRVVDAK